MKPRLRWDTAFSVNLASPTSKSVKTVIQKVLLPILGVNLSQCNRYFSVVSPSSSVENMISVMKLTMGR